MQDIDRPEEFGSAGGADSPPCWIYKPAFGVVHTTNCTVCRSYMIHVVVANHSSETSFKEALNDKESRISSAFLEGVQSGRQLQQEYDAPVLDRYRAERDKALQSLGHHQALLVDATKELDMLRDQILALQMALEEQSHNDDNNESAKSPTSTNVSSSMEHLLISPSAELDYIDVLTPLSTDNQALPTTPDHVSDATLVEVPKPKSPIIGTAPQDFVSSPLPRVTVASVGLRVGTNTASVYGLPPRPSTYVHHPLPLIPPTSQSPQSPQSPQPPATQVELEALMKAAHAGDDASLTRIKAFAAFSHRTPRERRTELQRYILLNWRNRPRSESDPVHPTAGTPSPIEIYVDASSWGIGFVMGGMWLAWKFSDLLTASGNVIDSSWGEMLAVEIGLWTAIHWLKMKRQRDGDRFPIEILVRSDNAGVVKAIEKRHANYLPQQTILLRIFDMCREHGIQISVEWVPGLENLADNPSRGIATPGSTPIPFAPPIPSHLSDVLNSMY